MFKRLIIYGTGNAGGIAYQLLNDDYAIEAFCSTLPEEDDFYGIPVILPSELNECEFDKIIIASSFVNEVLHELEKNGVEKDQISIMSAKHLVNIDYINRAKRVRTEVEKNGLEIDDYNEALQLCALACCEGDSIEYFMWRDRVQQLLVDVAKDHRADKDLVLLRYWSEVDRLGSLNKDESWNILNDVDRLRLEAVDALLNGNQGKAREIAAPLCNHDNRSYNDVFSGKRVAIIGPAGHPVDWKSIENNFDVVVVISLDGTEKINHSSLVMYVRAHGVLDHDGNLSEIIDNGSGSNIVMECVNESSLFGLNDSEIAKFRVMIEPFRMFMGFPWFLQRMLLDILFTYDIESINIFNFDMFTSKKIYNDSYGPVSDDKNIFYQPPDILHKNAVSHDPISQFRLTSRLISNNSNINVDEVLGKVLQYSETEYFNAHYNCTKNVF